MLKKSIVLVVMALSSTVPCSARALEKPGLVQSVAIGELMTPGRSAMKRWENRTRR